LAGGQKFSKIDRYYEISFWRVYRIWRWV
jgi:hypothetical protein